MDVPGSRKQSSLEELRLRYKKALMSKKKPPGHKEAEKPRKKATEKESDVMKKVDVDLEETKDVIYKSNSGTEGNMNVVEMSEIKKLLERQKNASANTGTVKKSLRKRKRNESIKIQIKRKAQDKRPVNAFCEAIGAESSNKKSKRDDDDRVNDDAGYENENGGDIVESGISTFTIPLRDESFEHMSENTDSGTTGAYSQGNVDNISSNRKKSRRELIMYDDI